ncbi:hypothetical protein ACH5RR_027621 [Cinchona calisaya]|uniref:BZIP domain-containing protein n=1 Tax=Cinchona calisaya TaxID=153742 RepID=A0ABD2Z5Z7_9GENT
MNDFGEEDDIVVYDEESNFLDHILDAGNIILPTDEFDPIPSAAGDSCCFSTIGQIQEFLFNDHDHNHIDDPNHHLTDQFLSDILLDSPLPPDSSSSPSANNLSPEIEDSSEKDQQQQHNQLLPMEMDEEKEKENPTTTRLNNCNSNSNTDEDADPLFKKRKRQLRNRDAAVRSRERKKMYVKDLEMKSRYYEAECRRLGMLLQCYLAENHALRLSLNNNTIPQAFDASTAKQESAVLFLESLLLGSLLWFLGIMALLILPKRLLPILEAAGAENVGCKNLGSLAPREAGNDVFGMLDFQFFMMSKRCRGSRRKMRCSIEVGFSNSLDVALSLLAPVTYC